MFLLICGLISALDSCIVGVCFGFLFSFESSGDVPDKQPVCPYILILLDTGMLQFVEKCLHWSKNSSVQWLDDVRHVGGENNSLNS